jgi:hypothetical protein
MSEGSSADAQTTLAPAGDHLRPLKPQHRILLPVLCVLMLGLNVLLLHALRQQKDLTEACRGLLGVAPGVRLPDLKGTDLQGHSVSASTTGPQKTILLVFSPNCGYCKKNWPNWQSLLSQLDRSVNVAFVNVTSTLDTSFLARQHIQNYRVLERVEPALKQEYRLTSTPQTIVIGPGGVVEKVWIGVLAAADIADIRAALAPVVRGTH